MKKKFLLLGCTLSMAGYAQVYTPNGAIQGTSGNNSVGIGTSSPSAKLDVVTNANTGALELQTTNAPGLFGTWTGSPFALRLNFLNNSTPEPITTQVFDVAYNGKTTIGYPLLFSTPSYLRVQDAIELARSASEYMQIGYRSNSSSHSIPTFSFDDAASETSIVDWGFGEDINSCNIRLRLHENGSLYAGDVANGRGFVSLAAEYQNDAGQSAVNTGVFLKSSGTNGENYALEIENGTQQRLLTLTNQGILNIGSHEPIIEGEYGLYVSNGIRTERIRVDLVGSWPDYVFDECYTMLSNDSLARFISEFRHLPYIPSQEEIGVDGYEVQQIDKGIVRNVEELTLRLLNADKRIRELEERLLKLEAEENK